MEDMAPDNYKLHKAYSYHVRKAFQNLKYYKNRLFCTRNDHYFVQNITNLI